MGIGKFLMEVGISHRLAVSRGKEIVHKVKWSERGWDLGLKLGKERN